MLSDPDGYRDETSVIQTYRFFDFAQNDNKIELFGHPFFFSYN